jgi:flavorubredoxin
MKITESILWVGVHDHAIDLFEGQYAVPNGMSYNSYVILDEQCAVMDTVDARFTGEWLEKVSAALGDREPDYLIIQHVEPDHSGSILRFLEKYPKVTLAATPKAFPMLKNFYGVDPGARVELKADTVLALGSRSLHFVPAPMVHWPEVALTYDDRDRVLFSADAFGKFGAWDTEEPWTDEARRYYIGIVGKFGAPVQALLKKAAGLDIAAVCPLHGPVLKEDLGQYLALYDAWSAYRPEEKGILIAYTSVYGHTREAAELLKDLLAAKGQKVRLMDLARSDLEEAVAEAFRYDRLILASTSYNGGVFPRMRQFAEELAEHGFQNRKVGIAENGSWAPCAAKTIREKLEGCKNLTWAEPQVTIRSALDADSREALNALAAALAE